MVINRFDPLNIANNYVINKLQLSDSIIISSSYKALVTRQQFPKDLCCVSGVTEYGCECNSAVLYCVTEDNLRTLSDHKIIQHLVLVLGHYKGQDIQMATMKLLALVLSQGEHHSNVCRVLEVNNCRCS